MIKIGGKTIGEEEPVYIIAEAGVNHNGSFQLAQQLVDQAMEAGADAIKFQTFQADNLASEEAPLAAYQEDGRLKTQRELLRRLMLTKQQFKNLKQYCDRRGITFLSTPFDIDSARFLHQLGVEMFKVGSGDLTNLPLLMELASYNKPLLLSTGMATLGEIERSLSHLPAGQEVILLHCTSSYPAPYQDLHLRAIETLRRAFPHLIGYSDHSLGIEVPIAAVSLGYRVIEKHITLDRGLAGPDHRISLEPQQFKEMVTAIRHVEEALGTTLKNVQPSERENKTLVRKGIYLKRSLAKGKEVTMADLQFLRPARYIEASDVKQVLGRRLLRDKREGTPLRWSDLS